MEGVIPTLRLLVLLAAIGTSASVVGAAPGTLWAYLSYRLGAYRLEAGRSAGNIVRCGTCRASRAGNHRRWGEGAPASNRTQPRIGRELSTAVNLR